MTLHTTTHRNLNVSNISAVTGPDLDETLRVGYWEHLKQILTVMVTFVQATYALVTFVHISNISAVTGLIWIKL